MYNDCPRPTCIPALFRPDTSRTDENTRFRTPKYVLSVRDDYRISEESVRYALTGRRNYVIVSNVPSQRARTRLQRAYGHRSCMHGVPFTTSSRVLSYRAPFSQRGLIWRFVSIHENDSFPPISYLANIVVVYVNVAER